MQNLLRKVYEKILLLTPAIFRGDYRSMSILKEALLMGEVERGRVSDLTGYQERRARQILSELLKRGLLISQGPRAPVCLGFPLDVVERWFPSLYPIS
jgi:hypothetical protein